MTQQLTFLIDFSINGYTSPALNYPQNEYKIVTALSKDDDAWMNMLAACGEFPATNPDYYRREIIGHSTHAGAFLIKKGGEIVGCSALCVYVGKHYPIWNYLYVKPEHRGKGLGKVLGNRIIWAAEFSLFDGVMAITDEHRKDAIHVFERLGFGRVQE